MGAKLIILRHGEKPKGAKSALELAPKGKARAQFLAEIYLGRDAKTPVLGRDKPYAFFAVTPHTVQTASPSAESWDLPVTAFCTAAKDAAKEAELDRRTQQAAEAIRHALARGRNVVVVWEHHRIADARLPPETTLRGLLNLAPPGLHETWPDDDYDAIWIVRCTRRGKPEEIESIAQQFVYAPGKSKSRSKAKKKSKAKPEAKPRKGRS